MGKNKLTEQITQINNSTKSNGISVARLVKLIGKRSHYVMSFLSFLLVLLPIPMPPGFVLILAFPSLLITAQILYGVDKIFLPKFILEIKISKAIIRKIDALSKKYLQKVEKMTKKRIQVLSNPKLRKIQDVILFICALGCAMPIPFVCMVPAFAGACLSASLIIGDGLLTIIGWLCCCVGWGLIWSTIKAFILLKNHIPSF